MANPTPPIQSCVLRVGIKCFCKGCRTKAKRKLQSVSGVNAVEFNAEEGLVTVSGDEVDPMTLLHELAKCKWGKNAEIVGDNNNSSTPVPEHNQTTKTMEKEEKRSTTKCFLLRCFRKQSGKAKVEPYAATPFINRRSENHGGPVFPPRVYPPPQPMYSLQAPIPYPPPFFGLPPPPYYAPMHSPPPYYQTANSRLL